MKKVTIRTEAHQSEIITGEKWTDFVSRLPSGINAIITDENIKRIYGGQFPDLPIFCIMPGEKSKSLSVIEDIAGRLLSAGVDRGGFLVGIGGGVVCDITGFIGSIYMRGIRFGFVSSSLLSQVDASVGGKNGVNLGTVKNILGTFRQPEFVICDTTMLKTLPEDEYLSGLAELIKMSAILNKSLFGKIESNFKGIMDRDPSVMESLIYESVKLKAEVVNNDEKETGGRMILNFGHTFGHAIEAETGAKHGFAVASGMKIACDISVMEGVLRKEKSERIINLLNVYGLLKDNDIPVDTCRKLISSDKKRHGKDVSFVLLESIGKAVMKNIPVSKLVAYFDKIKKGE